MNYPFQLENVHAFFQYSPDEEQAYHIHDAKHLETGFEMVRESDLEGRMVPESLLDFYIVVQRINPESGELEPHQSKLPKHSPIWYNTLRMNFTTNIDTWIATIFPEDVP